MLPLNFDPRIKAWVRDEVSHKFYEIKWGIPTFRLVFSLLTFTSINEENFDFFLQTLENLKIAVKITIILYFMKFMTICIVISTISKSFHFSHKI